MLMVRCGIVMTEEKHDNNLFYILYNMPTGNSKFPWLNQKYVMEIEQRTANVPAWVKEIMQQKMYSDFYAQQKREEEQAERMAMKNQITQKELEAKSDEKAALRITNKKATLADGLRNFYKLNLSDWDDDTLISKFTSWIKDWDKMYIDYLNGDNNDIMVKTGLFGDTFKQLNEKQKVGMTPNVSNTVTEAQNKPKPTNLTSTSHFDDPEYAAHYLQNVDKEYKPFVDAAKQSWYPDWMVASMVDASKTYQDFLQRGFWDKAEEVNVGTFQGFVNFFGNAYNNLAGNNPYVWIAPKLNMQSIQFKDDLLGAWNNYGDLRASSWWTKWGEIFGDLLANTAVMMLLPWIWGEAKMESIAESALNNGTKWVVKNLAQRGVYGGLEWTEFGALATMGQENADLDKLSTNMTAWGTLWVGFWFLWAGANAYKYRNTLRTLAKEWDKEWTIKGLLDMYNRWIKPTSQWVKTNTQLQQYNDDAMWAVESIIKNKDALKYVDANWEETFGHLPKSVDEFSQAIKQTKQSIYDRYTAIAKEAWQTTDVDTSDIVKELRKQLNNKEWRAGQSEATIAKMEKWIKDLEELNNTMSVEWAQAKVQELNQKIQAFLKSQNPNDVSPNAVDGLVLNGLKKWIDDAIEKAGLDSEEYIQLRNIYRQLRSIESDVNHRAVVYGRQNPQSLVDSMSDLQTIDAIADIFSNPIWWTVKLLKTKAFKAIAKDRNNSNKIVENMFKDADDTISKTDTLKSQTQIANERAERQAYNIRKNRAQRLQERQEAYNSKEQARQALLEKQQQQEAAYQEYLRNKWVGSETQALPQREWVNNYNTIIADSWAPTVVTPEWTAVRQWQIAETPTKNVNYAKPSENNPIVNEKTWETLNDAIEKLRAQWWEEETINNFKEAVLKKAKWEEYKLGKKTLDELIEPVDTKVTEVYHGTRSDVADNILKEWYKPSSELPENAYRGWGYWQNQEVISFATDRESANTFAKASWKGEVLKTEIKDWANVVKIKWDYDAEDLAEYLPELREKGIDAVILDNGENEFVVINRDIIWKSEKASNVSKPKAEQKTNKYYDSNVELIKKHTNWWIEDVRTIDKYKWHLKEIWDNAWPDDYVVLRHNTKSDRVDSIIDNWIQSRSTRGDTSYWEDAPWLNRAIADENLKNPWDDTWYWWNEIYFRIKKKDAEKHFANKEALEFFFPFDIKPEDIVAVNRAVKVWDYQWVNSIHWLYKYIENAKNKWGMSIDELAWNENDYIKFWTDLFNKVEWNPLKTYKESKTTKSSK